MKDKKIRDAFLAHQTRYEQMTGDDYTATQMAAIATRVDFNLTKEQLMKQLGIKSNE